MIVQVHTTTHPVPFDELYGQPFMGTIMFDWVTTNRTKINWSAGRTIDTTIRLADKPGGRTWYGKKKPPVERILDPKDPLDWVYHSRQAVQVRR